MAGQGKSGARAPKFKRGIEETTTTTTTTTVTDLPIDNASSVLLREDCSAGNLGSRGRGTLTHRNLPCNAMYEEVSTTAWILDAVV